MPHTGATPPNWRAPSGLDALDAVASRAPPGCSGRTVRFAQVPRLGVHALDEGVCLASVSPRTVVDVRRAQWGVRTLDGVCLHRPASPGARIPEHAGQSLRVLRG